MRISLDNHTQFQALRYLTLESTDLGSHQQPASMGRRYIRWRNRHAEELDLNEVIKRANVA